MMTARELTELLDRTGTIDLDGLAVQIRVLDARIRFGETDLQVSPVAGSGTRWARAYAVTLDPAV